MSGVKNVYILASKMMSQKKNLAVISNNVANVNTNGYKKIKMDFGSLVTKKDGVEVATFAKAAPLRIDFSAGDFSPTNNPLDLAINGDGMFAVNVGGETQYTRNGHFLIDSEGNMITSQGNMILNRNNGEINIPIGTKDISVSRDGTVSTELGILDEIGIFSMDDKASVENLGKGMYRTSEGVTVMIEPQVIQGMLENANVSAVEETVQLTELMRKYQSISQLVGRVEEIEGRAIRDLARMPN